MKRTAVPMYHHSVGILMSIPTRSLFASDFSKSELQRMIPSLSKWRIDQAHDHAIKSGKGQPVEDRPILRSRIDSTKVDHFLDFISRPELLQDVAFGTKTLRLDSGVHIVIPAAVRTLIPSRIIEQYTAYCKQQEFKPASERSLHRMLDVCSLYRMLDLDLCLESTSVAYYYTRRSKARTLNKLDQETCLITCDWAMKFLPLKYRENMSEFFGKRGLSWHVSAVVTTNAGKYKVECFVRILNSCIQNNYTIASVFEHLFRTIKTEYSLINIAYIQSENAGCYHNGPLLLCLPDIAKRTGMIVARYDFSEPQSCKDIWDRKIAPMKTHIRRFVNENHDVVSAEDMKVALESQGGLKGCRAAVVEVNSSNDLFEGNKIPDISLHYNFQYETSGIRVRQITNIQRSSNSIAGSHECESC